MAAAVAQAWSNIGASGNVAVTISGVQVGDVLHVATHLFNTVSDAAGLPTDNQSNTYIANTGAVVVWDATFRCFTTTHRLVVAGTPPTTVTGHRTGASNGMAVSVLRLTGVDTTTPVVDNGTGNKQTSATPATTAITTTTAGIIIVDCTHDGATTTIAEAAGWTLGVELEDASTFPHHSNYQVFAAAQTSLSETITLGASRDLSMTMTPYKAAATYQPRHGATNFQDPGVFMRKRERLYVPRLWLPREKGLALA